jgi:hypothetical protein
MNLQLMAAYILVKGYFVIVIASVFQRSNPLKTKRLLRQKAPRNDLHSNPQRVYLAFYSRLQKLCKQP